MPWTPFVSQRPNPGAGTQWRWRSSGAWRMLLVGRPVTRAGSPELGVSGPDEAQRDLQCHLAHKDGCEDVVGHSEEDAFLKEMGDAMGCRKSTSQAREQPRASQGRPHVSAPDGPLPATAPSAWPTALPQVPALTVLPASIWGRSRAMVIQFRKMKARTT